MKRFKYRCPLVYLTPDNVITTRRNSQIDLYLRVRRKESLFPSNCLIIARISFKKERVGHGIRFVRYLTEIAIKYGFNYIGVESVNNKSRNFAEKLGFCSIDGYNYVATTGRLTEYFQN